MPRPGEIDTLCPFLLETENHIKLLEPFTGTKIHHKMECLVCNHQWTATPLSKRQTLKKHGVSGCPACNKQRKNVIKHTIQQVHIDKLTQMGVQILSEFSTLRTTRKKLKFQNVNCGHIFETYPGNLIELKTKCTVCGKLERTAAITNWSKTNSTKWRETATEWQTYKAEVSSITEQTYKKYCNQINPNHFPRGKAGVDGAYHLDHIVPKRFCFDNNIPAIICADRSNLQMIGWRENVGSRNHIKGTIPPVFFQYITTNSKLEQYAKQLKDIIPSCEIFVRIADVIVTAYDHVSNRAIVVLPIDNSHANMKSGLATQRALSAANIPFIILFEDEMIDNQLLSAKLKHYTNAGNAIRIHARQCDIRECTKAEKKKLLDVNHVQGNDNANIAYGAYYNDTMIAVMTFSFPRVALGQKNNTNHQCGSWELSRFCTDTNYRIPGIASKLLTYFKRNHPWTEIYSYADKRWSVGNMYHKLGFELVADNPPDYFYIIDGKRKHRWNYRKDIIKKTLPNYDPTLTEYQNMQNHGFYRVWDCGTMKFSIKNTDY